MKINELAQKLNAEILSMPSPDAEVTGGYCGDLLSWVMGRAKEGQVWITIMTNINIVAVASLSEVSAILLTESSEVDNGVIEKAKEQGINVLRTAMSSYEAALAVGTISK